MLGFPCNQFGNQEPGSPEEIRAFVTTNYDVDFPMFAKIEVNGEGQAELYRLLKEQQPGEGDSPDIGWNFEKFLVGPDGTAIARWGTGVTPEDIAGQLDELMGRN